MSIEIYVVDKDGKSRANEGFGPLIAESEADIEGVIEAFIHKNSREEDASYFREDCFDRLYQEADDSKELPPGVMSRECVYIYYISFQYYFTLEKPSDFMKETDTIGFE